MKTKITYLIDAALAFVSRWIIVFTIILIALLLVIEVSASTTVTLYGADVWSKGTEALKDSV